MITQMPFTAEEIASEVKGKVRYKYDTESLFAEEVATRFYKENGYEVIWAENDYWWTIMSLLFWDVIFARVEGAVCISREGVEYNLNPSDDQYESVFQSFVVKINGMPHDFFSGEFYFNREQIISNRIKELRNADLSEKLKSSYQTNYGKLCRPIEKWDKYSLNQLVSPLQAFSKDIVLGICERLLLDFSSNRAGFPDLLVFRPNESFFVEVKSKNDRISDHQLEWHEYLSEDLGQRVELFLINHSERQISSIQKRKKPVGKQVKISFGQSSSSKREEAIKYISQMPTFQKSGEDKNAIYSATVFASDISVLYTLLDLTSGWKSQHIEIDGEIVKSTDLRNSLWCFKQKCESHSSGSWCKKSNHSHGNKNPFGCSQVYFTEFNDDQWKRFGYIDTDRGEWVFDREAIKNELEEQIRRFKYCPLINPDNILKVMEKVPDRIRPSENLEWGFRAQDYSLWIYSSGEWLSFYSNKKFPGYAMMTSLARISKRERNDVIRSNKNRYEEISSIRLNIPSASKKAKSKAGCFIASCVYGDHDAKEVIVLRNFRDRYLLNRTFGRVLVRAYYTTGPYLAKMLVRSEKAKCLIRFSIDCLIRKIETLHK